MTNDESKYEAVGNIRIKQPKKRKNKKSNTSLITKIFVWFMFIAMAASFIGPLVYYFIRIISES